MEYKDDRFFRPEVGLVYQGSESVSIARGKHARLESLHEKAFRARVGSPSVIRPVTVDALKQRNEIAHVSPSPDRVIDRGLERFCERYSLSLYRSESPAVEMEGRRRTERRRKARGCF
jgi:hypothetical protein